MKNALILALDLGTSSVRAMLFDAHGRSIPDAEAQIPYSQTITADGGVETEAEALLERTVRCVRRLLRKTGREDRGRIAGVGVSCFWHSLVGVGRDGRAVTPLLSWADARAWRQADALRAEMGEEAYHKRTGCVLHPSFWPAKLRWLAETAPEKFEQAQTWMSFGEYLALRLFGSAACSLSMASGTGLLNPNTKQWDTETLAVLPIMPGQLNALTIPAAPQSGLAAEWASEMSALKDLPWLPASGDGACSNVGSGATEAGRIAINIGTSGAMRVAVPADTLKIADGLFCYRVDDERFLVGGAFANGGNVYAWMQKTLQAVKRGAAAAVPPDGHGLTVLPFWAGERSPHWHLDARAAVTGMSLHTTPTDLQRASLEAISYRFAAVHDLLTQYYPSATEIVASGGALVHDPLWIQIMADVLETPITTSRVFEASSRGAALLAARSLGLIDSFADTPTYLWKTYQPDPARRDVYRQARVRHEALYAQMLGKNQK